MKFAIRLICIVVLVALSIQHVPRISAQAISRITIGASLLGAPIEAVRFGNGPRKLVIVGNTHGGPERNTYVLSNLLIDWFTTHPADVPAGVRLYIIPTLNPDGERLDLRQNANGVDLNRNMNTTLDACADNDWSTRVYGAYGVLSDTGGPYADSEVESRVIRSFLLDASSVVFLHSAAGLVFPAQCEDAVAIAMAQAYAKAGEYQYARFWENYPITGGMHDWARGLELPAIIPELESGDEPEFERNLAGIKALLANPDLYIPLVTEKTADGVTMPLPIWRFWQAHGAAHLGQPIGMTVSNDGIFVQEFATIRLAFDPRRDTHAVYALPLELPAIQGDVVPVLDESSIMRFAGTDATLHDAFATYYQQIDGQYVLGAPQDFERMAVMPQAPAESRQQFTFGVIRYDARTNSVERLPVVWQRAVVQQLIAPTQPFQIR
jgi:hypothetical protein